MRSRDGIFPELPAPGEKKKIGADILGEKGGKTVSENNTLVLSNPRKGGTSIRSVSRKVGANRPAEHVELLKVDTVEESATLCQTHYRKI